MADQESEIHQLRIYLEGWKLILLGIKDVLLWKKQYYPIAILGGTTILFTLIWLFEPSNLSLISLIGLFITICDYFGQSVLSTLVRQNSNRDREFFEICSYLVLYKTKFEMTYSWYLKTRQNKPKLFYFLTILSLGSLTYVGCSVNNLFLAYLIINSVLLLPGTVHNGIWKNLYQAAHKVFENLKQNQRIKVNAVNKEN